MKMIKIFFLTFSLLLGPAMASKIPSIDFSTLGDNSSYVVIMEVSSFQRNEVQKNKNSFIEYSAVLKPLSFAKGKPFKKEIKMRFFIGGMKGFNPLLIKGQKYVVFMDQDLELMHPQSIVAFN